MANHIVHVCVFDYLGKLISRSYNICTKWDRLCCKQIIFKRKPYDHTQLYFKIIGIVMFTLLELNAKAQPFTFDHWWSLLLLNLIWSEYIASNMNLTRRP